VTTAVKEGGKVGEELLISSIPEKSFSLKTFFVQSEFYYVGQKDIVVIFQEQRRDSMVTPLAWPESEKLLSKTVGKQDLSRGLKQENSVGD
jgi:hypothetical protein